MSTGPSSLVFDRSFQLVKNFHAEIVVASITFFSCVPPAAIIRFGAPDGGSVVPSRSALLRKFTPAMTKHCSRAGLPASIFERSATHACFSITSSPVLVGT
jgi:hypothetical protein